VPKRKRQDDTKDIRNPFPFIRHKKPPRKKQNSQYVSSYNSTYHHIGTTSRFILFFGCYRMNGRTTSTKGSKHNRIAQDIQLLLDFSLHIVVQWFSILSQGDTIQVIRLRPLHEAIDLFASFRHSLQDRFQFSYFGLFPTLNFEIALKGFEILLLGTRSGCG
jgi:hypothetical protein